MARVTGPLLSLNARGTLGGQLTYRWTLLGQVAQFPPRPTKPPSPAQLSARAAFRAALALWATLAPAERAKWKAAAALHKLPPHNLLMLEIRAQATPPGIAPFVPR